VWARIIGQRSNETLGTNALGHIEARTTLAGFQGGFDLRRWTWDDGSSTHAGISLGYANASSTSRARGIGGSSSFDGGIAGLHLTHYDRAGWYADAGVYGAWIDIDTKVAGEKPGTQSTAWLASIEMGRSFELGWGGLSFEPQAQLIYHNRGMDSLTEGATDWRFNLDDALVGRLGARLKSTINLDPDGRRKATGHVKASLWSMLTGSDDRIDIGTLPINVDGRRTWADVGLGVTVEAADGWSIFADGDVEFDVNGADYFAVSGRAGARLNW
jgi:outer membrane autotransporter protein